LEVSKLREVVCVVLPAVNRAVEVLADLSIIDIKCRYHFDITDVITAEIDMHESGDRLARVSVCVIVQALNEATGAISYANNCNFNARHARTNSLQTAPYDVSSTSRNLLA